VLFEERRHAVVEHIGSHQDVFAVIEFGERYLGVSIEKGLLINATYALGGAHVVSVLGAEIARMRGLDLAMGLFLLAGPF
jgi:hypothetical protein